MAAIDKVRVLVVGDSGVGKTSLTHLIANNEPLISPGWTIGCSVEAKLHEYKDGTQMQTTFFVELWDIGGSINHKNTRNCFYQPTNGIILVHDLTNRKSHDNLQKWLYEILNKDAKDTAKGNDYDCDLEQFFGSTQLKKLQIPILVIGTKYDIIDESQRSKLSHGIVNNIAQQCGADEIFLNSHDVKSLAAGTTDSVKLTRFFDKVIESRYYSRDQCLYGDKRKFTSTPFNSPLNTPFTSPFNSFLTNSTYSNQSENKNLF